LEHKGFRPDLFLKKRIRLFPVVDQNKPTHDKTISLFASGGELQSIEFFLQLLSEDFAGSSRQMTLDFVAPL
jgi:hypothetical protein